MCKYLTVQMRHTPACINDLQEIDAITRVKMACTEMVGRQREQTARLFKGHCHGTMHNKQAVISATCMCLYAFQAM